MSGIVHGFLFLYWAVVLLVPFETDGKWGYKNSAGRVVVPPRYDVAHEFSPEGIAAVADEKGWAFIDTRGSVVVRPLLVDNGPDGFAEDFARFVADGKVGFFDRRGKIAIRASYDFALPFSEGRAVVCRGCRAEQQGEHRAVRGGAWGFIDRRGTVIIPLRFEEASSFEDGRARVRLGGRWRYIDVRGRVLAR